MGLPNVVLAFGENRRPFNLKNWKACVEGNEYLPVMLAYAENFGQARCVDALKPGSLRARFFHTCIELLPEMIYNKPNVEGWAEAP